MGLPWSGSAGWIPQLSQCAKFAEGQPGAFQTRARSILFRPSADEESSVTGSNTKWGVLVLDSAFRKRGLKVILDFCGFSAAFAFRSTRQSRRGRHHWLAKPGAAGELPITASHPGQPYGAVRLRVLKELGRKASRSKCACRRKIATEMKMRQVFDVSDYVARLDSTNSFGVQRAFPGMQRGIGYRHTPARYQCASGRRL